MKALGGLLVPDVEELEDEDFLDGPVLLDTELDSLGDHFKLIGVGLSECATLLLRLALAFLITCELSSLNMRSTKFR